MFSQLVRAAVIFSSAVLAALPALAEEGGSVSAPLPRVIASPIRLSPVAGASSFTTGNTVSTNNFNRGFSAGLFADIGPGAWTFETGILSLQSNGSTSGDSGAINVNSWGIPLLAKLNFSGKPQETVFLKAGVMPFRFTGDQTGFNVMGVGGIGAALPLGRSSALLLDASYNRLFTRSGDLTDYQGIALLAGLSFNI